MLIVNRSVLREKFYKAQLREIHYNEKNYKKTTIFLTRFKFYEGLNFFVIVLFCFLHEYRKLKDRKFFRVTNNSPEQK